MGDYHSNRLQLIIVSAMPHFVVTPATLAWSPLFVGYYTYLAAQVSTFRVQTGCMLGETDDAEKADPSGIVLSDPAERKMAGKKLRIAVRGHSNFAENVPLSMLLITVAELNGAPTWVAHAGYAILFAARVIHVELGLKKSDTIGRGRLVGHLTNYLVVNVGFGLYNFALGWDSLKTFASFVAQHGPFVG